MIPWLSEIKERLERATPYEEKPGSKCPECQLETFGYRHWMGCTLEEKHREVLRHAPKDISDLLRANEIMEKALEYYDQSLPGDIYYAIDHDFKRVYVGGQRARQALADVNALGKEGEE